MSKTTKKAPAKTAKKTVKKTTVKPAVKNKPTIKKIKTAPAKTEVKKSPANKGKSVPAKKTVKKIVSKKIVEKKALVVKNETQKLADAVVEGILEIKGKNITVMDLRGIHNRVCDYFIICQADSNTQVNAIADSIQETVRKTTGDKPYRSEGFENSEWILIDYVTVVVHIFQSHIRDFYNLESLWADAETVEIAFD